MSDTRPDGEWIAALCGFAPCHFEEGTGAFAHIALQQEAISKLAPDSIAKLRVDNRAIFEKCRTAMWNNGIPEAKIKRARERIRIFGG